MKLFLFFFFKKKTSVFQGFPDTVMQFLIRLQKNEVLVTHC